MIRVREKGQVFEAIQWLDDPEVFREWHQRRFPAGLPLEVQDVQYALPVPRLLFTALDRRTAVAPGAWILWDGATSFLHLSDEEYRERYEVLV